MGRARDLCIVKLCSSCPGNISTASIEAIMADIQKTLQTLSDEYSKLQTGNLLPSHSLSVPSHSIPSFATQQNSNRQSMPAKN